MLTDKNPARVAANLLKDAGVEVDESLVDEYVLFCETAVIEGRPLTNEWRIIGALVKKLGGSATVTSEDLSDVQSIVFDGDLETVATIMAS